MTEVDRQEKAENLAELELRERLNRAPKLLEETSYAALLSDLIHDILMELPEADE